MTLDNIRARAAGETSSATNQMKVRRIKPMTMTLAEIKEVLDANPDHPQADSLRRFYNEHAAILSPDTVVAVERAVVLGILDGLPIVDKTVGLDSDGREIHETVTGEDF